MIHLCALAAGYLLDLCFGDPRFLPHPVVLMGKMITGLEQLLRRIFPKTPRGLIGAGAVLAVFLPLFWCGISALVLWLLWLVHPAPMFVVESFFCYQLLAVKDLKKESMLVYKAVVEGDLPRSRSMVSRIVGRDTQNLSFTGVTKAAVETVAENLSDGVIAPMCFMLVGGAPLGFFYKAVNTMDSMIGYKNDRYLFFGRAAARFDDLLNFIPSRFAALLLIVSAFFLRYDAKGAWRVFRRDRFNHASPNSAQTESACAGALGVQLAGDASYFGKLVHKKTIGDPLRPVEAEDIRRANRLLYLSSALCLLICCVLRAAVFVSIFCVTGGWHWL